MPETGEIKKIRSVINNESIYKELLTRSGGRFEGDRNIIKLFEPIYKNLHTLAMEIGATYVDISKKFGLNPGKIDVVWGGGRAKGKLFRKDSDIDLFFYIGNPSESIDSIPLNKYPNNPLSAVDEQYIKMKSLVTKITSICEEQKIPNFFHVMGYGSGILRNYRKDDQLLLASIDK